MSLTSELYSIIQEIYKGKKPYWISMYGNNPEVMAEFIYEKFIPKTDQDKQDIARFLAQTKHNKSFDSAIESNKILWDNNEGKDLTTSDYVIRLIDNDLIESFCNVNGNKFMQQLFECLYLVKNLTGEQKSKVIAWKMNQDMEI